MTADRPRFREINESDIDAVADLLTRGFVHRPRDYWLNGLLRQRNRDIPADVPRFGYMLESEGVPVGCLLLIFSTRSPNGTPEIFCNLSSWYVDPPFRNYAGLLSSMAQKRKDVTYMNVTPAHFTWPVIEAQGFRPYCRGLYFCAPAMSLPTSSATPGGMRVESVAADTRAIDGLPDSELALLKRHAGYGCLSVVCHSAQGPAPFIFLRLRKRRGFIPMPVVQLGYCRSTADFVRCAGPLGRFLLRRGKPVVAVEAGGPMPGLFGSYREDSIRRYFKGPFEPRLGDLSDTELVLYGM